MVSDLATPKKRVLIVTHNMAAMGGGGGVEVYQEFLRQMPNSDISFLFRIKREGKRYWYLQNSDNQISSYPFPTEIPPIWLRSKEVEDTFSKILKDNHFDLIHFQHLLWHPLSLPLIAKNLGIPTLYTLHDHFLVCSRFNLTGLENTYCDTFNEPIRQCDYCLKAKHNLPFGTQHNRRKFISEVLKSLSALIANTPWTKTNFLSIYPEVNADAIKVIEMLKPNSKSKQKTQIFSKLPPSDYLQVAIPGNFNHLKGAELILRLMDGLRNEKVHFTILGKVQETSYLQSIKNLKLQNLTIIGGYSVDEIEPILAHFDVSLLLSIWPETYMITLSETWSAGVVPIATNLGAQGERITDGHNGFIVKPNAAGHVHNILLELANNEERLSKLKENAKQTPVQTVDQHIQELDYLYKHLVKAKLPL